MSWLILLHSSALEPFVLAVKPVVRVGEAARSFILNGVIVKVAVGGGISSNRCCYSISACFLLQAEAPTLAGGSF